MKQLQHNYTDEKQSKRLLELGLPVDSADIGGFEDIMHGGVEILSIPYSQWCKGYESISYPIWSVGRLMEICDICNDDDEEWMLYSAVKKMLNLDYMEYLVKTIELAVACKRIDFSLLE